MKSIIRKYNLFLIAIGTLLLSIALHYLWNQNSNTEAYANKIEKFIHKQELDFLKVQDNKVIQQLIFSPDSLTNIEDWDQTIKSLQDKPYSIFIHKKDSLIFWSNVLVPMEKLDFKDFNQKKVSSTNANFWARQIKLKDEVTISGLIPINYKFKKEGDYLKNTSPPLKEGKVEFSFDTSLNSSLFDYEKISSLDKIPIAKINAQKKINNWQQLLISIMCLFSFLLVAFQIHKFAKRMRKSHGNLFATTFLLGSVFGIRYLTILLNSTALLKGFDIFNKNINSPLFSSSLGDLLINILIVTWLALFVHTSIQKFDFSGIKLIQRYLLSALNYFSIALGLLTVAGLIKSLVINSGIVFDFENVFNLDRFSFISLLGIIFLILSFFVLAHGVVLTIIKLRLPTNIRIFTMFMAIVFSVPFFFFFELDIPFLPYYSGMIIFILLMDLMADNRKPNVTWFFAWMITLSALMAALLFKYNSDFDIAERLKFAKSIELERDEIAIASIADIRSTIASLEVKGEILNTLYPFQFSKPAVDSFKNTLLYGQDYLNENFELEVYIYDQFGNGYQDDQTKYLVTFGNFEETYLKDSIHQIYYKKSEEGKELYYIKTNFEIAKNPDAPFQLIFEFTSKDKVFSNINYGISNSLLSDKWNRNEKDFALYVGGKRIQSNNPVYPQYYPFKKLPRQGTSRSFVYGERSELVYLSNTNLAILAGRNLAGLLKPISLFSYIFTLLCLSVFGLAIINTYFPFLPPALRLTVNRGPSLRYRIQFVMIMLTIVSFIFIGLVTVYYFNNTSKQNAINDLQEKTNTLIAAFENEIKDNKTVQEVNQDLTYKTSPIAKYQKSAFQLFNATGQLISSSDPELYKEEIIGKKINYLPYLAMRDYGRNLFIQENKWYNNFKLQQAFAPVEWKGKNVAYLSVLQVADQRVKDSGVNEFMGTLLNVYVFLFLIAGAIAIAIANSITRPLSVLGDKLKQLKLDKTNEPLKWDNQDELGELINDYNVMIEKLEESAQLLAITERDTAWREMARQVAHEIKNPLTPMQLSIQHLQNTMRRNPDADIKPMVDRVATTLLEQIKNLSLIAGEFSNFAKMPQAKNEKVILNEIVSSAHDLFRKRDDMDINLYIPIDEIYVFADHNQLVRVLNNLVKNAIQAIPTDKRGRVDILLYKEEGKAIIKISDNGTGIAEEMKEKVFRPNFTTKTSGTGLGLAICSSIIESFNGKIYFETKENVGTQFYVEIPLMRLEDNFREEERVSL